MKGEHKINTVFFKPKDELCHVALYFAIISDGSRAAQRSDLQVKTLCQSTGFHFTTILRKIKSGHGIQWQNPNILQQLCFYLQANKRRQQCFYSSLTALLKQVKPLANPVVSGNINTLILSFCSKLQCIHWVPLTLQTGREPSGSGLEWSRRGDHQQCEGHAQTFPPLQTC